MPELVQHTAVVSVTGELIRAIGARPGDVVEVVSNDIPADAKFVGSAYDLVSNLLYLYVEHPSFPATPYGQQLPRLRGPTFQVRPVDAPVVVEG